MRVFALCTSLLLPIGPSLAQSTPPAADDAAAPITIDQTATLETGDTLLQNGVRYRLWGVQACLPGTTATLANGQEEDCGTVSRTGLSALLADAETVCFEIARSEWKGQPYAFTSCSMRVGEQEVELGTALIASGLAFAALTPQGEPVHPPYAAAEVAAKADRNGLWGAKLFVHPAQALLNFELYSDRATDTALSE